MFRTVLFSTRTDFHLYKIILSFTTSSSGYFKSFKEAQAHINSTKHKEKSVIDLKIETIVNSEKIDVKERNKNKGKKLKIHQLIALKTPLGIESAVQQSITKTFQPAVTDIFIYDAIERDRVRVYTDGSCKPARNGENIAGIGVFWAAECPLNVSDKYVGQQTNNRAEIAAVIAAVRVAIQHGVHKLLVVTDSEFTINCMTKWVPKWRLNGWKLANKRSVECRDVIEQLDRLIIDSGIDLKWQHVAAHSGDDGNCQADLLANAGADQWLQSG